MRVRIAREQVMLRLQALGRQAKDRAGRVASPGGQVAERPAADHADGGVGHGLGRDAVGLAQLQAEMVAGEVELVDLAAAVAKDAVGPDRARDDLVDVVGGFAFSEDLLVAGEARAGARHGENGVETAIEVDGRFEALGADRRQHWKPLVARGLLRQSKSREIRGSRLRKPR